MCFKSTYIPLTPSQNRVMASARLQAGLRSKKFCAVSARFRFGDPMGFPSSEMALSKWWKLARLLP